VVRDRLGQIQPVVGAISAGSALPDYRAACPTGYPVNPGAPRSQLPFAGNNHDHRQVVWISVRWPVG